MRSLLPYVLIATLAVAGVLKLAEMDRRLREIESRADVGEKIDALCDMIETQMKDFQERLTKVEVWRDGPK